LLDRVQAAAALAEDAFAFDRIRRVAPPWLLYVSLTATDFLPDQRMAWQRSDLTQLADQVGVHLVENAGLSASRLGRRTQQLPTTFYKDVPRGTHQEVFCLTQLSRVPELIEAARPVLARHRVGDGPDDDIVAGLYVQPTVQGSSCHFDFTLFHSPGAKARAHALERELTETLILAGGFFSRPYGRWAKEAYARDSRIVPYLLKAKNLFDPNGVLNPGRLCF
jgi:FAD/FMN-containing dehydrogenase